jgi:hypothetical protein
LVLAPELGKFRGAVTVVQEEDRAVLLAACANTERYSLAIMASGGARA